ncbi:uncharacterized protein LOC135489270 isoform X2 [Lineus longissimus]
MTDDENGEVVPEEIVSRLLQDERVTAIRRICREVGIQPKGSAADMVVQIREKAITRGQLDLAYEKVFGTSGGLVIGACPHGIVYSMKNLLRSESPRDYMDLLRSMKHRPNISVIDIAHLLAAHGNRTEAGFFSPNEGRLRAPTPQNIAMAKEGLMFDLPDLDDATTVEYDESETANGHPVSHSSSHYALYDWFHQGNCKREREKLRNISLLSGFAGYTNTQKVEQLFNSMKRDLYFLNQMSPVSHVFMCRLILHLHNEQLSKTIIQGQRDVCNRLSFNQLGQVIHQEDTQLMSGSRPTNGEPAESDVTARRARPRPTSEDINHSSSGAQGILPQNKETLPSDTAARPSLPTKQSTSKEDRSRARDVQDHGVHPQTSAILEKTHTITTGADRRGLQRLIDLREKLVGFTQRLSSTLDPEDTTALLLNIRYASETLFRSGRQHLVHGGVVQDRYMQCQGNSNYCATCAVNNLLGYHDDGTFPVPINEMDDIADEMWLASFRQPTARVLPVRDIEGFYNFEVMDICLQRRNYTSTRLRRDVVSAVQPLEIVQNCLLGEKNTIGWIVHLSHSEHYITIKITSPGIYVRMDSGSMGVPSTSVMTAEDVGRFIKNHSLGQGGVYQVHQNTSHPMHSAVQEDPESGPGLVEETPQSHGHSVVPEDPVSGPGPVEETTQSHGALPSCIALQREFQTCPSSEQRWD